MGKKIISYSLWGNLPIYTIGAIRNAELAKEIYPDWICRFYIGDDVSDDIVSQLDDFDNTEVIIMEHKENDWQGMFWRFYAVNANDDVDYVIFRDTDSRLSVREREAVKEWMDSGKYFHIMRDHPYHNEPIMGGMWGCKPKSFIARMNEEYHEINEESQTKLKNPEVVDMESIINNWLAYEHIRTNQQIGNYIIEDKYNLKGIDQHFLRYVIYGLVYKDSWIQDDYPHYNCWSGRFDDVKSGHNTKEINTGFPSARNKNWNDFIGQVYDENDFPVKEYADILEERDSCTYKDY
jgi:hypothetical protein